MQPNNRAKANILVIDDDPHLLRAISRTLQPATRELIEASTAQDGLRLARQHLPDLILVDVVLPDLDGFELCRRIKTDPSLKDCWVVLVSSIKTDSETQAQGLENGADGYIARPISNRELLARVQALLHLKQTQDALRETHSELEDRIQRRTAELAQSIGQWHVTFNAIGDSITLLTPDGEVMQCNEATVELLGRPRDEILGRRCWELMHGTSERIEGCPAVRTLESGCRASMELPWGGRFFEVTTDPVFDETGEMIQIVHIISDITEHKRAQQALRESEERHRTLVHNIPIGVYRNTPGPDGRFLMANAAFLRMFGLQSMEELQQCAVADLYVNPEERKAFSDRLLAQGRVTGVELQLKKRDGSFIWGSVTAQVVYSNDSDQAAHFDCTIEDITARKEAEEQLQQIKEFNEGLIQNMAEALILIDHRGHLSFANPAITDLLGYTPEELVGKHWQTFVPADQQPLVEEASHRRERGEKVGHYELELLRQDGQRVPVMVSASGRYDEITHRLINTMVVFTNIAARKQAEVERERLLKAEREQRMLAETLREVTLTLTSRIDEPSTVLDEVLQQAKRIVPYNTAHIMLLEGDTLRSACCHGYQDESAKRYFAELTQHLNDLPLDAQVIRSQKPRVIPDAHQEPGWISFEETAWVRSHLTVPICLQDRVLGLIRLDSDTPGRFSLKDARRLEPLASAAAIALENARLYEKVQSYAIEMATRVAERTRELSEAYEELKELDRMKSKFVTDVSHELRTPVANIKLYLHLLNDAAPEKKKKFLQVLNEQTDRLTGLIETILDLSQIDVGGREAQFVPVDLNALAGEIVDTNASRAETTGLELTFEPHPDLPSVLAEPGQLGRVITNLIDNAINYTPAGSVRVSTTLEEAQSQACLQIADTGRGISPHDLPHIFERFYRGQDVGSSNIPGSGLGLAIVKEIVDRHGGQVKIESRVGEGTTVTVWLPLARKET